MYKKNQRFLCKKTKVFVSAHLGIVLRTGNDFAYTDHLQCKLDKNLYNKQSIFTRQKVKFEITSFALF